MDIVWLLDSSTSTSPVYQEYEGLLLEDWTRDMRQFITDFTAQVIMSPTDTRQAIVQYAGEYWVNDVYSAFTTIGPYRTFSDPTATSNSLWNSHISSVVTIGGTSNTTGAIDWVRMNILTPDTVRPGATRIVVLVVDGAPSNRAGIPSNLENDALVVAAETSAAALVAEDGAIFVVLEYANDQYPPNWFTDVAHSIYLATSVSQLNALLTSSEFLCFAT